MLWEAVQQHHRIRFRVASFDEVQPDAVDGDEAVSHSTYVRKGYVRKRIAWNQGIVRHMTKVSAKPDIVKPLTNSVESRPLGDLMRQAQQRLVSYLDTALGEAGYTDVGSAHVSVLATVDGHGTRLSSLVQRGGRTKQATAELAGQLVSRGYADVEPDPADRRAKLYVPTERGLALLAAAADVVADYESWLDEMLGQKAIAQLRRSLITIIG